MVCLDVAWAKFCLAHESTSRKVGGQGIWQGEAAEPKFRNPRARPAATESRIDSFESGMEECREVEVVGGF